MFQFVGFARHLGFGKLTGVRDRQPFHKHHGASTGNQAGEGGRQYGLVTRASACDPHDQAEIRYEPIVGAQNGGTKVVAGGNAAMPGLGAGDFGALCGFGSSPVRHCLDDRGVVTFLRRHPGRLRIARVFIAVRELRGGERGQDEARAQYVDEPLHHIGFETAPVRYPFAMRPELVCPDFGVGSFGCGQFSKDGLALGVGLDVRQGFVDGSAMQFVSVVGAVPADSMPGRNEKLRSLRVERLYRQA
jgi:hypothetical protein